MARRRSDELLEAKLQEARQLEAEIKRLRNAARDRQRAADEQRRRIVGRIVLARLKARPEDDVSQAILAWLSEDVTRPGERALFPHLPARAAAAADEQTRGQAAA